MGRIASLRFRPKNMAHHIFQLETELQNIPEAAPGASRSFSVSEKLARYGSSALSGVEHLGLLVGKDSIADALLRHLVLLRRQTRVVIYGRVTIIRGELLPAPFQNGHISSI